MNKLNPYINSEHKSKSRAMMQKKVCSVMKTENGQYEK